MFKIIKLFILSFTALVLTCETTPAAWPWGSKSQDLVTINKIPYTPDDYMHWLENWSGKDKKRSHDMQPFIEWKLLAQEALSMELDQRPSVQRKNEVFLKVQRRLQFKHETVDSKIRISEQDRKDRFEADYNPVSYFTFLYFRSAEKAKEAHQSLKKGTISFEELQDLSEAEGGPHQKRQQQYYPLKLKGVPTLEKIVGTLQVGEVSAVFPMGSLSVLARLDRQEAPDAGLYKERRRDIQTRIIKEQSAQFTSELINTLWKKYDVQVDEDLFAQVRGDMAGEILEQPIVTTTVADIPLVLLVKDIRKEDSYRQVEDWPAEQRTKLYRGVLNGMIIEYLITWESIERRYEEKAPLKWSYAYYQEKTLIKELEKLLLEPQAMLQEEEIKKYYQEHKEEFRNPDLVTLTMADGEKESIEKIWQEISRVGGDFFEVANRHNANFTPLQDVELGKLSPEFKAAVQNLDKGEVSAPFTSSNNKYVLVKLVDRKYGEQQSQKSVRETIIKKLKPEKFKKIRKEYVEKLLAHSEVEVNKKAWEMLIADQEKQ